MMKKIFLSIFLILICVGMFFNSKNIYANEEERNPPDNASFYIYFDSDKFVYYMGNDIHLVGMTQDDLNPYMQIIPQINLGNPDDSKYIINILKNTQLKSTDNYCIYSKYDLDLHLFANLNIESNITNASDTIHASGINCEGNVYITKDNNEEKYLNYNVFLYGLDGSDYTLNDKVSSVSFFIYSDGEVKLENLNINSNIADSFICASKKVTILNSNINNILQDHDYISQLGIRNIALIDCYNFQASEKSVEIKNSNITSKLNVDDSNYSYVYSGILSQNAVDLIDSSFEFKGNNYYDNANVNYRKQCGILSSNIINIKNSSVDIQNTNLGIISSYNQANAYDVIISDSDIKIISENTCLISNHSIKVDYENFDDHSFIIQKNNAELYPISRNKNANVIFCIEQDSTYDFNINSDSDTIYSVQAFVDETNHSEFNVNDLLSYKKIEIFLEAQPDLIIRTLGHDNIVFIDDDCLRNNLDLSMQVDYENDLYTITLLGDVTLSTNDRPSIELIDSEKELKIIGNGKKLTFNIDYDDTNDAQEIYCIKSASSITIGDEIYDENELYGIEPIKIIVNEMPIIQERNYSNNFLITDFNSIKDININNADIETNTSGNTMISMTGSINIKYSKLNRTVYFNKNLDRYQIDICGRARNSSNKLSIYRSNITTTIANNEHNRTNYVFANVPFDAEIIASNLNINSNSDSLCDGSLNPSAIYCKNLYTEYSSININDFYSGIFSTGDINIENTTMNSSSLSTFFKANNFTLTENDGANGAFNIKLTNENDFQDEILESLFNIQNDIIFNIPFGRYVEASSNLNDYSNFNLDNVSTYKAIRLAGEQILPDLIINDCGNICWYNSDGLIDGEKSGKISVNYNQENESYYIEIIDDIDFDLHNYYFINGQSYNDIYIFGDNKTVKLNIYNDNYNNIISSSKDLYIGNDSGNNLKLIINDGNIVSETNLDNLIPVNPIYASGKLYIDNCYIYSKTYGPLIEDYGRVINISNSNIIHEFYPFVNNEDINLHYTSIYCDYTCDVSFNNSKFNSKLIQKDNVHIPYNGIYLSWSGNINILNGSSLKIEGDPLFYNNENTCYGIKIDESDDSTATDDNIKIENSELVINNMFIGIKTDGDIDVKNSNLDIKSFSSCLYTSEGSISFEDDGLDQERFVKLYSTNNSEISGTDSIFAPLHAKIENDNYLINFNLDDNIDVKAATSLEGQKVDYQLADNDNYRLIVYGNDGGQDLPTDYDLVINFNENKKLFYKEGQALTDSDDGLTVIYGSDEFSRIDHYKIIVNSHVTLNSINEPCIYTKEGSNKSIYILSADGEDDNVSLNLNVNLDDSNTANRIAAISSDSELALLSNAENREEHKFKITINDIFNKQHKDDDIEHILISGFSSKDSIRFFNCDIETNNFGECVIQDFNSEETSNFDAQYTNFKHTIINVSNITENYFFYSINVRNNLTMQYVNYDLNLDEDNNSSHLLINGFNGTNVKIYISNIHLNGNSNCYDGTMGINSKFGEISAGSNIYIKDFAYGIRLSSTDTPYIFDDSIVNIESFGPCIYSKINFVFDYQYLLDETNNFKLHLNNSNVDPSSTYYNLPIVYVEGGDYSNPESIFTYSDTFNTDNIFFGFSVDDELNNYEELNENNINTYKYANLLVIINENNAELVLTNNDKKALYYSGNNYGDELGIDNLLVSYYNGTYTLTVLQDITLTSTDYPIIKTNSSSVSINIEGKGNLNLNVNSTDSSIMCNGISILGNLDINKVNQANNFTINFNNYQGLNDSYLSNISDNLYLYQTSCFIKAYGLYMKDVTINSKTFGSFAECDSLIRIENCFMDNEFYDLGNSQFYLLKSNYQNSTNGIAIRNSNIKSKCIFDQDLLQFDNYSIYGVILSTNSQVLIDNSHLEFYGNPNEDNSLCISTNSNFIVQNNSSLLIDDYSRGIYSANRIFFNNSDINIKTDIAPIYSKDAFIYTNDDSTNHSFNVQRNNPQNKIIPGYDTPSSCITSATNDYSININNPNFGLYGYNQSTSNLLTSNNFSSLHSDLIKISLQEIIDDNSDLVLPGDGGEPGHMPYYKDPDDNKYYYDDPVTGEKTVIGDQEDLEEWMQEGGEGYIAPFIDTNVIPCNLYCDDTIISKIDLKLSKQNHKYALIATGVNATEDNFICVMINGQILNQKSSSGDKNYNLSFGSIDIEFTKSYLSSLTKGHYTYDIITKNGKSSGSFDVINTSSNSGNNESNHTYYIPKTGIK